MKTLLRSIAAVIVGLVVGGCVNMALIVLGSTVVPAPAGVDVTDARSIAAAINRYEPKHFLFPLLAHALGTLAGATAAFLVASRFRAGFAYAVGLFFLAGGVAAAGMIPAPKWFVALDLVGAYIPMAWLGTRLGRRVLKTESAPRVAPAG